jgi:drug/metabolite transporter (DMT)-like permease
MSTQTEWATGSRTNATGKRWTTRALWMLLVFAGWAVLCTIAAWTLHAFLDPQPVRGEPVPVESFGSWLTFLLVLVVPLVLGMALAAYALVRGGGRRAMVALLLHLAALVLVLTPAIVDRIGPPTV